LVERGQLLSRRVRENRQVSRCIGGVANQLARVERGVSPDDFVRNVKRVWPRIRRSGRDPSDGVHFSHRTPSIIIDSWRQRLHRLAQVKS
jgi:hypothetical protein